MDQAQFWIAQGFTGIAIILGFVSFQLKTQRQLIVAQTATALMFCISYLLLDAPTGLALNLVAIFRNIVYYIRDKKGSKNMLFPIIFACIQGSMGVLTWQGWYSALSAAGIVINTLCMSFKNPQNVRKSILFTSPMVLIYNACVQSYGGIIYESVAIASSLLGILRTRKQTAAVN